MWYRYSLKFQTSIIIILKNSIFRKFRHKISINDYKVHVYEIFFKKNYEL